MSFMKMVKIYGKENKLSDKNKKKKTLLNL